MGKVEDGYGAFENCPRCDEVIVNINDRGVSVRLSRRSIPLPDALVLSRYGRIVFNIWRTPSHRLMANAWWPTERKPVRGHLFVPHDCWGRK